MKRIKLAAIFILVCGGMVAAQEHRQELREPLLRVQGRAEVQVEADEASVGLGVSHVAATAAQAQQTVNRNAQAIFEAIEEIGIPRKEIQTSNLSLYPIVSQQPERQEYTPRITGYRASNTISIHVTDLSKLGQVIDVSTSAGANEIQGVSFSLKDEWKSQQQALADAVKQAAEKARVMAQALGVELKRVIEIAESGVGVQPMYESYAGRGVMMQAKDSTPVAPGQVTVTASVQVTYSIGG